MQFYLSFHLFPFENEQEGKKKNAIWSKANILQISDKGVFPRRWTGLPAIRHVVTAPCSVPHCHATLPLNDKQHIDDPTEFCQQCPVVTHGQRDAKVPFAKWYTQDHEMRNWDTLPLKMSNWALCCFPAEHLSAFLPPLTLLSQSPSKELEKPH